MEPYAYLLLRGAGGVHPSLKEGANPPLKEGANPPLNEGVHPSSKEGVHPSLREVENSSMQGVDSDETASPINIEQRHMRWYQRRSPLFELPEGYEKVYVEFGCGRGRFINAMATADPDALYIGVEGCKTILIRALAKTHEAALPNVRYIDAFINDPDSAFAEDSLAGVFLNFSDPWPKDRHADRRLTSPAKADAYRRILAPGGFASVKTDSEGFFTYSLGTFTKAGFSIAGSVCEISNSTHSGAELVARAAATPTEYELRFRSEGLQIYQFTAL